MKKYLYLLILFIILIPCFVEAKTCDMSKVTIDSVSLSDINGNVREKSDPVIENNNTIGFDLSMNDLGDNIIYEIVIKNDSIEDVTIDTNNLTESDYVKYSFLNEDDPIIIKPNTTKTILLKIEYENEVPEELVSGDTYDDSNEIVLSLQGKELINPNTSKNYYIISIILIILTITYVTIQKRRATALLIICLLVAPMIVYGVCKSDITLMSNVSLNTKKAIFNTGSLLSNKMRNLSGNIETIKSFRRSDVLPDDIREMIENDVAGKQKPSQSIYIFSSEQSDYLIYGWYDADEQIIYYYCERVTVYLNANSSNLFYNFTELVSAPGIEVVNTSIVTNMANMFRNCSKLETINLSNFNTSNVTKMSYMFSTCTSLTSLDLRSFNTEKVTAMDWMFEDCTSLTELRIDNFDTSNVTNMAMMFSGCGSITRLDLSHFDTSSCTNMRYMFCNNYALTYLDVSSFDTSNVTDMGWMFSGTTSLTKLDLRNFDTRKVTTMQSMFSLDENLIELNISSFRTPALTNMQRMFGTCSKLESLDLSYFDTSNVTNMSFLFEKDEKLSNLDISSFDTSQVTTMFSMFHTCKSITSLDLRNFDTSNVTSMYCMFYGMENITSIDLSSFDTSKVTSITNMFRYDRNLEHIYVSDGWTTASVTESTANYQGGASVFTDCVKLPNYTVGQNGKAKAHYGEGGYLTYKSN